jgi:serine phosphatase RsbU (regulator of sigma subunit)
LIDVVPGTLIVAATDGLTEARSADNELFGMARFIAAVDALRNESPETIVHEIFETVDDFSDGRLHDDVAALAVRIGV